MFSSSTLYREDIENVINSNIDWTNFQDKKILITGATGLIGTVLVDSLMYKNSKDNSNISVIVFARNKNKAENRFRHYLDNSFFKIIQGDVTDVISVSEKDIDFVINLAANTHPALYLSEPIKTIDTIVTGTKNILSLAVSSNSKRVINTSSVEIYGENRGDVDKFTEDYCGYINCNTLRAGYTEGKRLAEAICQAYIAEKGIDIISVRLGRVYGSTQQDSDTKSTTQFIRNAVNNEDIVLKSTGTQQFSYVYVADAVVAFLLLLTRGESGEAYNVASDEVKSFRQTADILAGISSTNVLLDIPNKAELQGGSAVQKALMDSSKIKSIGWQSRYTLAEGLERTVEILRSSDGE